MNSKKRKYKNELECTFLKKKKYNSIEISDIIKVQTFMRRKLSYNRFVNIWDKNNQITDNKKFSNETTLIGTTLPNIKKKYRYVLCENNTNYFFDIRELYNHLKTNTKNPYTNNIIKIRYQKQINRICTKLVQAGNKLNYSNPIPKESVNSVLITEFINKLHKHDGYTTFDQLYKLEDVDLFVILSKLVVHFNSSYTLDIMYAYLKYHSSILLYFIKIVNEMFQLNPNKNDIISIQVCDLINLLTSENEYEADYDTVYYTRFVTYSPSNENTNSLSVEF